LWRSAAARYDHDGAHDDDHDGTAGRDDAAAGFDDDDDAYRKRNTTAIGGRVSSPGVAGVEQAGALLSLTGGASVTA
jgi:hypothetical protein